MQRYILVFILFISSLYAHGQTKGLIFKPASSAGGKAILDPNGDGYSSQTTEGFQSNDWGWGESEIKYQPIPILENEPIQDPLRGPGCGFTDMVDSGEGDPVGFYFDGTNFLVRFRLNKTSPNSKGYSVLIDADEKFGFSGADADPNALAGNPGFELEMVLMTNHSVSLYNVDGTNSPVLLATRDYESHTQKSIAFTEECDDADYFYDFYLPWSVFGIPSTTTLRMTALTIMNPQPAIGNNAKSDVGGVDDRKYSGNYDLLFENFIDNFYPTSPADNNNGLKARATCPTINSLLVTSTSITGTSAEAAGTTITVYKNNVISGSSNVTSTGTWSTSVSGLTEGDIITASAKAVDKEESESNCSAILVGQSCTRPDPPTLGTSSGNSNKYISITPSATGILNLYQGDAQLVSNFSATGGTTYYFCAGTSTLSLSSSCGGGNNLPAGVYRSTLTASGCSSNSSFRCVNTSTASSLPVINEPITTLSKTISGTSPVGAEVILKINGIEVIKVKAVDGTWSIPTASFGLTSTDNISAYSVESGKCQSAETAPVAVLQAVSMAPEITGSYCGTTSTVKGTSSEAEGTTINLYIGSSTSTIGTTISDNRGNWQISGLSISTGSQLIAKATATGKSESAASFAVTVLAVTSNTGLAFTGSTDPYGTETLMPVDPATGIKFISEDVIAISGDGPAGSGTVKLYSDEIFIGSGTVSGGKWAVLKSENINNFFLFAGAELTATFTGTGACESDPIMPPINVICAPPSDKTISPTSVILCSGSTPEVQISTSQPFIIYQLFNGTTSISSSTLGNGSNITLRTTSPLTTSTPSSVVNLTVKASKIAFVKGVNCETIFSEQQAVTLNPEITNNSIQAPDAGVSYCGSTNIGTITGSNPSGGDGVTYTYQWQTSSDNVVWNSISGATEKDLSPGEISASTYFRRQVFSGSCSDTNASAASLITIEPSSLTNTLSYSGQTSSCSTLNPGLISGTTTGTTFQWQISTDGLNYYDIPEAAAKAESYDHPNEVTQSTYFRRVVSDGSCKLVSDPIFFEITPGITNNFLTAPATTAFCNNGEVTEISGNIPSGGSGGITYKWQKSTDNGINYVDISPAIVSQNYTPGTLPSTTYFRRIAESNLCALSISNEIKIVVASPANSIISAEDDAIYANGSSTTNIIIQLKDAFNEGVPFQTCTVDITSDNGTISGINYLNNGTYSAILTSSNVEGMATISGSLDGSALSGTIQVNFTSESTTGPNMTLSTISASSTTVDADGSSTSLITIQFKDGDNLDMAVDSDEVTILIDGVAVASNLVSNPSAGTYQVTLPARTNADSELVSTKYFGNTLDKNVTVSFVPVIDLSKSTITASSTTVNSDGTSTSIVTVQFKDYAGNNIVATATDLTLLVDGVAVDAADITSNGSGSYSITLPARTTAGTDVVTAQYEGTDLNNEVSVEFIPVIDPTKSTITASSTTVNADGTSTSIVTVQFKDYAGNNIVATATDLNILVDGVAVDATDITSNGSGSYSITLPARTTAGTDVVTAQYEGADLSDEVSVEYILMPINEPDLLKSTITASKTIVDADGLTTSIITVQFKDNTGKNVVTDISKVKILIDNIEVNGIISLGDGSFEVELPGRTDVGTIEITSQFDGKEIDQRISIQYIQPTLYAPNLTLSSIIASPTKVEANGISTAIIVIQFKDDDGNNLTVDGTKVKLFADGVLLDGMIDKTNGRFEVIIPARNLEGIAHITATYDGTDLLESATITFIKGDAHGKNSLISSSETSIPADGTSTSEISVIIYDAEGNRITTGGDIVTLQTTLGTLTDLIDNLDGTYTITLISSTEVGTAIVIGQVNGMELGNAINIIFHNTGPSNTPPTVADDIFTVETSVKLQGNVLLNDEDPDNHNLTINSGLVEKPSMGTISITSDGNFEYTSNKGFTGEDRFTYLACDDGVPSLCSEATVYIQVIQPELFIPKGFSPDGDGENDEFIIYNGDKYIVSVTIFNRWGNKVYENKNYKNDWTGIANYGIVIGENLPDGTYFYVVDFNNGEKPQSHYLIIKRNR